MRQVRVPDVMRFSVIFACLACTGCAPTFPLENTILRFVLSVQNAQECSVEGPNIAVRSELGLGQETIIVSGDPNGAMMRCTLNDGRGPSVVSEDLARFAPYGQTEQAMLWMATIRGAGPVEIGYTPDVGVRTVPLPDMIFDVTE